MENYHTLITNLVCHHLGENAASETKIQNFLSDLDPHLIRHSEQDEGSSGATFNSDANLDDLSELRAMLEAIPENFFHINQEDEIISFKLSESFCDLGHKEPAIGHELFTCFPAGASPQLHTLFKQSRSSEQECHSEVSLTDVFQKKYVYGIRVIPRENKHLMVILRDITRPYRDELSIAKSIECFTKQNAAIAKIAANIDNAIALQDFLGVATKEISDTINASKTSVWFFEKHKQQFVCQRLYHLSRNSFEQAVSLPEDCFPEYFSTLATSNILAVNHARDDVRSKPLLTFDQYKTKHVVSFIDVAIKVGGQLVGILAIDAEDKYRQWSADEQQFATTAARLISLAYQAVQDDIQNKAIQQNGGKFKVFAENCNTPLFAYAESLLFVNKAMETLSGFTFSQLKKFGIAPLLGSNFIEHFPTSPPSDELVNIYSHEGVKGLEKQSSPLHLEVEITPANSLARWLSVRVVPVRLEGKNAWLCSAFDISDYKLSETKLRYKAYHDDLTGLPNRTMFSGKLKQSFEERSRDKYYRFAILHIELDRLNFVNINLGPLYGEQLLLEAARRLRQICRNGDTLARLGGNEFTLLMKNVANIEEVLTFSKLIQKVIAKPINISDNEVITTASIGVAYSNRRYEKVEDALKDADIALFRAKSHGEGGCEVFNATTCGKSQKLMGVDKALGEAIKNNQLQMLYQPIVDLRSGKLATFEALIRWKVLGDDYLPTSELIQVAEESGHMVPLGNWTLNSACQQMRNALGEDSNLGISVSLSPRQLDKMGIIEFVRKTLNDYCIPPRNLQLEIRETTNIEEGGNIHKNLQALQRLGCEISLDGFGSGQSSLRYLNKFRFKYIKIDKSLVDTFLDDENSMNTLKTIIFAASRFGSAVVAECVENNKQLSELINLGCHYAQGYLFSKPVTDKIAAKMLGRSWNLTTGTIRRDSKLKMSQFLK